MGYRYRWKCFIFKISNQFENFQNVQFLHDQKCIFGKVNHFISNNVRFYVTKAIEIVDKKLVIRIECKSPQTRRVSFVVHNQYKEHWIYVRIGKNHDFTMLNSVCLVYIGIINRSYINNYYCKDYIYKQKKFKLFVCKKERKIIFFRIAKKKKPRTTSNYLAIWHSWLKKTKKNNRVYMATRSILFKHVFTTENHAILKPKWRNLKPYFAF